MRELMGWALSSPHTHILATATRGQHQAAPVSLAFSLGALWAPQARLLGERA